MCSAKKVMMQANDSSVGRQKRLANAKAKSSGTVGACWSTSSDGYGACTKEIVMARAVRTKTRERMDMK